MDHHIHNDININIQGDVKEVEVSLSAFQYANPLLAKVDGVQGKVFSKYLHRAVLRFISDNGIDTGRINRILIVRFQISGEQFPADPDINQDGTVNILDLVIVAKAFEKFDAKADLNGDGEINILDLVIVANSMTDS